MVEKLTPLAELHKKLGARMVPFAGYSMPVSYSSIREEHQAVRKACGLFDVSHMGNFFLDGDGSLESLEKLCVSKVAELSDGKILYSALGLENGAAVDDILVTRLGNENYHIVVNAANRQKDLEWMFARLCGQAVLNDRSDELAILALQGPASESVIRKVLGESVTALSVYHAGNAEFEGVRFMVSRTGYTGEDGFELYPEAKLAPLLWNRILEAGASEGILPVGLGARDTLRLESGFTLYGHELNEKINLVESGLSWIVDFDRSNYIGASALHHLKQEGSNRKLLGLEMLEKAIPRDGCPVITAEGIVGRVTSGTLSPLTGRGIALALVKKDSCKRGDEVSVEIRSREKKAKVRARRFYQRPRD